MFYREQKWLAEKKEVLSAVTERVATLRNENETLSEHRYSFTEVCMRKVTIRQACRQETCGKQVLKRISAFFFCKDEIYMQGVVRKMTVMPGSFKKSVSLQYIFSCFCMTSLVTVISVIYRECMELSLKLATPKFMVAFRQLWHCCTNS